MFDHNGRVPAQRTTESMSEHLRDKTIKQRPKRMPGEKDERPFKELSEEWENEKKKSSNRPKKEGESFLDVIGKGDDPKFSKKLVRKAMESGKQTEQVGRDFAPTLSKEDLALAEKEAVPKGTAGPGPADAAAEPRVGAKDLGAKQELNSETEALAAGSATAPTLGDKAPKAPPIAAANPELSSKLEERPLSKKPKAIEEEKVTATAAAPLDDASEQVAASQTPVAPIAEAGLTQDTARPPAPMRQDLQQLVEKMVEQLSTVTTTDRTETVITLGQNGVFRGAEVTLTEFKSAQGEFNVSFTNLSPEAKALVDNPDNQGMLKQAMESKGYPLHIIVTSAQERETLIAEAQETFDREDQQGQQRGDQEQEPDEEDA